VQLRQLWLSDFRNYPSFELHLPPGLTVLGGANGEGKTNLLEAVAYLATLASFRGAPNEALVRDGCSRAVVRGLGERSGREILVEAEVLATGRGRATLNRQPVRRTADLADGVACSVFSPDDIDLVKGGPAGRRRMLDELLVHLHPRADVQRRDLERILRQRTALLRQMAAGGGGRGPLRPDTTTTLAVWDAKLVEVGEAVGAARAELVTGLGPGVDAAYRALSGPDDPIPSTSAVALAYDAPWRAGGLERALAAVRADELRRGVCLAGPHRDDLVITLAGMPARTHSSQGEQRSLALALRLAAHRMVTDRLGEPPLLLLDDVFSELDATRRSALLVELPPGQAVLTTTGPVPEGAEVAQLLPLARVGAGGDGR